MFGLAVCLTVLFDSIYHCCRDTQASDLKQVAVKVLTAHATASVISDQSQEFNVFRKIDGLRTSHLGAKPALRVSRCFTHYSSVGNHICFATDVLGPHLGVLRMLQPGKVLSSAVTPRIIKHVPLALDFLHTECGYLHTDVKSDNVLASLSNRDIQEQLSDMTIKNSNAELRDTSTAVPSRPLRLETIPGWSEFKVHQCLPVKLMPGLAPRSSTAELSDHWTKCQPTLVRAPEVILGHSCTREVTFGLSAVCSGKTLRHTRKVYSFTT
ncbi:hypothetical protein C8J56DRAFT_1114671 [Mycena floridula]|nr:hypothetical protein C8J56DRAFT_1114671 [Mycena floridula]